MEKILVLASLVSLSMGQRTATLPRLCLLEYLAYHPIADVFDLSLELGLNHLLRVSGGHFCV